MTDLRSENIETVVFSTESCTSTLSLSDVAALGAGSTPFALSHSGSTSTFTVGGADITLTGLAIAALCGVILNAILPGNDYEFGVSVTGDKSADLGSY